MKVLVVDDSLVVRTIIEKTVQQMGHEAVQAGNGQEALDILAQQADDVKLVLLDWNMPVMDGHDTIMNIKKNKAYNHLCIIMISTESEDDKIDQVLEAGANGYLAKPFSQEELTAKIESTLADFKAK
jgi:two-component system chemotaxis response regulator CheY